MSTTCYSRVHANAGAREPQARRAPELVLSTSGDTRGPHRVADGEAVAGTALVALAIPAWLSDRPEGLYRKRYVFQVRNDTGEEHFTRVSKRYRRLSFVVVYGDPNGDCYGSALIAKGERQEYVISPRQARAVWRKHKVTLEDEDEWRFWEASWELMDLAEAHWTSRPRRA